MWARRQSEMKASLSLCVFAAIAAMVVLFNNVALAQEAEATTTAVDGRVYRVFAGDTLNGLADDFGLTVEAIIDANTSREGVLINRCGHLPRRIRANEAVLPGCVWLREGVDITIPREPVPVVETSDVSVDDGDGAAGDTLSLSSIPLELETRLEAIAEEDAAFATKVGRSLISLHTKANRIERSQEGLSEEMKRVNFLLRLSLVVNIIFLLMLVATRRTAKKQERVLKGAHGEVMAKLDELIYLLQEQAPAACNCPPTHRQSPPPPVYPATYQYTASPPQGKNFLNCVSDGVVDFPLTLEQRKDDRDKRHDTPDHPSLSPDELNGDEDEDSFPGEPTKIVTSAPAEEERPSVPENFGRFVQSILLLSPSEVPDGPPPDDPEETPDESL